MKLGEKSLYLCSVVFISSAVYTTSLPPSSENLQITFLDVGAGDCVYIETPSGDDILIDGGIKSKGAKVI